MEDEQIIRQPKCCCCNINIGLGILFLFNVLYGILTLVSGSYPIGIIYLVLGLLGLFVTWRKKYFKPFMILYSVGIVIIIAMAILAMATAKSTGVPPEVIKSIYIIAAVSIFISLIMELLTITYVKRMRQYHKLQ